MKRLDGVGKDHEEFKLRLDKEKAVELAQISIQKDIAAAQAEVISHALKSAKIDIVGGETVFFDKIIGAITQGKTIDRMVNNSDVVTSVKNQLLEDPQGRTMLEQIGSIFRESNLKTEDVKNISVTALIAKLMAQTDSDEKKSMLQQMLDLAKSSGLGSQSASDLGLLS